MNAGPCPAWPPPPPPARPAVQTPPGLREKGPPGVGTRSSPAGGRAWAGRGAQGHRSSRRPQRRRDSEHRDLEVRARCPGVGASVFFTAAWYSSVRPAHPARLSIRCRALCCPHVLAVPPRTGLRVSLGGESRSHVEIQAPLFRGPAPRSLTITYTGEAGRKADTCPDLICDSPKRGWAT